MSYNGDPIHGHLHSADASSGVAVPIFKDGSLTPYTLADGEYICVSSFELNTAPGGDCTLFISPDTTADTGEVVSRGTYAANGGIDREHIMFAGQPDASVHVIAPAGVVDVSFTGYVKRTGTLKNPSFKASRF